MQHGLSQLEVGDRWKNPWGLLAQLNGTHVNCGPADVRQYDKHFRENYRENP